jgi:hypothetical protein
MANITNAQAVKFCNEKLRVLADLQERLYETYRRVKAEWDTFGGVALIPNDASPIIDGATVLTGTADGRKPITGAMVTNIITRGFEYATDMEASASAKLATIRQVSVNGGPAV